MFAVMRAVRAVTLGAAILILGAPAAQACQACFGAAPSPLIDGAKAGAWALIGVTVGMQGVFAGFFIYLRRRARKASHDERDADWARLQREARLR